MSQLLFISEARNFFPKKNGKATPVRTVRRWIAQGVSRNGRPVKLKAVRVGDCYATTEEWMQLFIEERSGRRTDSRTRKTRLGSDIEAQRFLITEGVYGREDKKEVPIRRVPPRCGKVRAVPEALSERASQSEEGCAARNPGRSGDVPTPVHAATNGL